MVLAEGGLIGTGRERIELDELTEGWLQLEESKEGYISFNLSS